MLLYRVFPHRAQAQQAQPGHPLHISPRQGSGRFDNPDLYIACYAAAEPEGAIAEAFADLTVWSDAMFPFPLIPGARRALATLELPDTLPYIDLDDPQRLLELHARPSQIVQRDRPYTQALAARIYRQHLYNGLRWWSFHGPQWHVYCLWEITPTLVNVQQLTTNHPAVSNAATALTREIH